MPDPKPTSSFLVFLTIGIILVVALTACAHKPAAKAAAEPVATAPPPTHEKRTPTASGSSTDIAASPNVSVSGDLASACKPHFDEPPSAPTFDYNASVLLPADRDVLTEVAECLISGPLAGRSITLVGRADPRGTDEYNMALGARRAETVGAYLERLGVETARVADTTRGALDASGTDEASWRVDRRVDLQLVQ
jgi:peptidoglycan-associated lipoprotein